MTLPRDRNRSHAINPVSTEGVGAGPAADLRSHSQFEPPLSSQKPMRTVQRVNANPNERIVTPQSGIIANDNESRAYLYFRNKSSLTIFINFGSEAADGIGEQIDPGGFYEPSVIPVNSVYAWSVGSAKLFFLEGQ